MMVLEGEQMKNANDQFREVRANSAQDITSKIVSIKFKNFKELIEGRGSPRTLLSLERFFIYTASVQLHRLGDVLNPAV